MITTCGRKPLRRLLERQRARIESGNLLLVDPALEHVEWLRQWPNPAVCLDWRAMRDAPEQWHWGIEKELTAQAALVFQPKSKMRENMLWAWLAAHMPESSRIYVVGANRGGIKSAAKRMKNVCVDVAKIDSAAHASLYQGNLIAGGTFTLSDFAQTLPVSSGDFVAQLKHYPGVFSAARLDVGTQMLLSVFPNVEAGQRVLDFGCGNGVISCRAAWADAQVVATDVDYFALLSTRLNLAQFSISSEVLPSDGVPRGLAAFDHIISNPPFHQGLAENRDLGRNFIRDAWGQLKPGGLLTFVANRHLAYEQVLRTLPTPLNVLAEDSQFRVFQVRKPVA